MVGGRILGQNLTFSKLFGNCFKFFTPTNRGLYSPKESSLQILRGVPLVECSHYLVLLVSKFFHPEEACFFFFCVGGGGGGVVGVFTSWYFAPC